MPTIHNGFIKACERGLKNVVSILTGPGATLDIDCRDKNGVSGLLRACYRGQLEIIEILYKNKCCLTVKDSWDCSATHYAAEGDHVDVLCFLHKVGFQGFDQRSKRGQTPLHFACKHGQVMTARYLLTVHSADATLHDTNGDTPLHLAFQNDLLTDYSELLSLLTHHGANVNAPNKRGVTALHMAAKHNLVAAVEALLEQQADPAAVDKNGVSPIIAASENGSVEVIQVLNNAGANVNSKDNEGNIPLQLACHHGQLEIAKFLIETGLSDVHSLDRNGQTPVHKACKGKDSQERSQLLQYLIEKGANVNLQSKYGRSPLHCACEDGNPDAAGILLKGGANVQPADRDGQTPLHYASFGGFSKFPTYNKVIELLLHYNADANQPGDQGMTAVHIAAKRSNVAALKLLLDFSGNPNATCEDGRTAVHHAVLGDPPKAEPSYEAVKILLDHGGETNDPDVVHGNTSIHYAAEGGHCDILQLLLQRGVKELRSNKYNKQPDDLAKNASVKNILMVAKMEMKYSTEETILLPVVKVFFTGHIKAGKTALRGHLGKSESKPRQSLHQRVEQNKDRTAGIEIEHLEHDLFGSVVAYDLAGHCEYTTSHSVVIDCGSNSVFAILFDITGNLSEIKSQVNYWAAFIKAGRLKSSTLQVLLVATHRDQALASGKTVADLQRTYSCVFKEIEIGYKNVLSLTQEVFIINCLDPTSQEMNHLRKAIGDSCESIKKAHPRVPGISLILQNQLKSISADKKKAAMTVERVVELIKQENKGLALREEAEPGLISSLLEYLSAMGMILKLKKWVIVDVEGVLGDVLSIIFAPNGFYTEDLTECKHGLLPLTRIESLFEHDFGTEVVVTILTELRLGVPLLDHSVIQVPALLRDIDMKARGWEDNNVYAQYAGFRFKLISKTDIFSPSLFPKFQVTMLQQYGSKVQLWTQGLCCIDNSVHVLIYMDEEKKFIDILLRSENLNEKACYFIREKLRKAIKNELSESSAGTDYHEQILRPSDLKCNKKSHSFIAYDLQKVQDHYYRHETSITSYGLHTDSIQELLFCNYLEIEATTAVTSGPTNYTSSNLPLTAPPRELFLWLSNELVHWKFLARYLGLEESLIDRIVLENHDNIREQCYRMLTAFQLKEGEGCTCQRLGEALLQSEKNRHLFAKYCAKLR